MAGKKKKDNPLYLKRPPLKRTEVFFIAWISKSFSDDWPFSPKDPATAHLQADTGVETALLGLIGAGLHRAEEGWTWPTRWRMRQFDYVGDPGKQTQIFDLRFLSYPFPTQPVSTEASAHSRSASSPVCCIKWRML